MKLTISCAERLGDSLRDEVVEILFKSFEADPAMVWFAGPTDSGVARRAIIEVLVAQHVGSNQPVWLVHEGERLLGCALVERAEGRLGKAIALAKLLPRLLFLPNGAFQRLNAYAALNRRGLPQSVSHYVVMMGVHPEAQGKGCGAALIRAIAEQAGPAAHIALDTEYDRNVGWYEGHGFVICGKHELSALTIWQMIRLPQQI